MATIDELKIWLEVARSLFPKAGFAVLVVTLVYVARQTWRTREDWRLGPPWSAYTRYLKKIHAALHYAGQLDFHKTIALYILPSRFQSDKRFNSEEAYDLESLLNLAVLEKKMLVLTGPAASGKTALLHALALRSSSSESHRKFGFSKPRIPFYIPSKQLNRELPFIKALTQALQASDLTLHALTVKRALRSGRALVMFDGLDEILDKAERQAFLLWLENAQRSEGKNAQFVLAGRPEAWLPDLELHAPHFMVALRNFALQKIRSLRAVTESRMPPILRSAKEAGAEYLLISPPPNPVLLYGANKMAPPYHFHLAKYPVTNRVYHTFVQTQDHKCPLFWGEQEFAEADFPVVGVDWEDAERYCAWLNHKETKDATDGFIFRLPTEEEWEWAASGNARLFPWGNDEPEEKHANFGEYNSRLTSVYAHPAGATPEAIMDMAGNVWEWTASVSSLKPEKRIVRGGAAFNHASVLKCTARDQHTKTAARFIGFRVARVPLDWEKFSHAL